MTILRKDGRSNRDRWRSIGREQRNCRKPKLWSCSVAERYSREIPEIFGSVMGGFLEFAWFISLFFLYSMLFYAILCYSLLGAGGKLSCLFDNSNSIWLCKTSKFPKTKSSSTRRRTKTAPSPCSSSPKHPSTPTSTHSTSRSTYHLNPVSTTSSNSNLFIWSGWTSKRLRTWKCLKISVSSICST